MTYFSIGQYAAEIERDALPHRIFCWPDTLTEVETRIIRNQIARGVGHIHDSGFLHRDLKPENIISAAELVLKVIDLGFALSTARENVSGVWGSDGFIALEVIGMKAHSRAMFIWSIGALFFIMLFDATQRLTKE
ncbi:Phosphoenolpyruvate carboxylase kinase 1 [Mortierella sp. AD032]|nr:Phosphoenolpyruvate carboxylase kinase 1 [Mortierella sp. AD032]